MGKKGRGPKKSKISGRSKDIDMEGMDDEIDTFHKQRDFLSLDVDNDTEMSDEDEMPVFDVEDGQNDSGDDDDDDGVVGGFEDGLAAKIVKQKKYLLAKYGNVDDEMDGNDTDQDEEDRTATWGGRKNRYFGGDNADFELQSSDDESLAEEEEEVLRLQRKAAESLTAEDFGLEDDSYKNNPESELTLEELSAKIKPKTHSMDLSEEVKHMDATVFEEVKKDLNSLTREEQMDVVYSSAPELVGLLSELNEATRVLENELNPLLSKFKSGDVKLKGGMRYLEVKQVLLLAYCQAIAFYLLLKSEGQLVRDHPVIARLVEIKALLDKMKDLDGNLPSDFEEVLKKKLAAETQADKNDGLSAMDALVEDHQSPEKVKNAQETVKQSDNDLMMDAKSLEKNNRKRKKQQLKGDERVCLQSMEMRKIRAALEERLKNTVLPDSIKSDPEKSTKPLQSINRQLEGFDDYGDDALDSEGAANRSSYVSTSQKVSQFVAAKLNRPKVVSGDDDLPKRDDIGERRRKYELRVLARAGVKSADDAGDELGDLEPDSDPDLVEDGTEGSEDDFYTQVKRQREAKLAAKANLYSRESLVPTFPETVEGKRQITTQMEKNRGLTRKRKKDLKNPRKKYRTKHQEKVKRRKGQVRDMRRPTGTYGGEATGINPGVSRSVRIKN